MEAAALVPGIIASNGAGSWQLISDFLLRREVNPWDWVLLGWVGTLLVGSQVMKLIMAGIQLIYGDQGKHSFLGRQLRGLLLFSISIVAWLVAVLFGVYVRKMHYGPVYGGLAAVFGLMVWMEFSALIVFLGAARNAESSIDRPRT
jgi:uncharacterized BrkB/YihY/UPF0761 family membrane protein